MGTGVSAELAHSFYSVFVSVSVFMALLTVFHSTNSPDNPPLSRSVLLVLFLPYWSFQLYLFMKVSLSSDLSFEVFHHTRSVRLLRVCHAPAVN